MIKTYRHAGLALFAETGNTRRLPVQQAAKRVRIILDALEAAGHPADLNMPGMHWHNLGPKWPNRWSLRVTGNYRITFGWDGEDAIDVDFEDYH